MRNLILIINLLFWLFFIPQEQLAKEKEAAENAAAGSSGNGKSRREEPEVNQNHLQQVKFILLCFLLIAVK